MSDLKEEIEKLKADEFSMEEPEEVEEEEEDDILDVILDLLIETREAVEGLREDLNRVKAGTF